MKKLLFILVLSFLIINTVSASELYEFKINGVENWKTGIVNVISFNTTNYTGFPVDVNRLNLSFSPEFNKTIEILRLKKGVYSIEIFFDKINITQTNFTLQMWEDDKSLIQHYLVNFDKELYTRNIWNYAKEMFTGKITKADLELYGLSSLVIVFVVITLLIIIDINHKRKQKQ